MRGDGTIFQRKGSNVLWCAYWLRGKQYRESTDQSDPDQARKFLRNRLTVGQLLEALRADFEIRKILSPQTVSHLGRAAADFGTHRAMELTAQQIDLYITERLAHGDRPASINRTLQMVSQGYRLAIRRKDLMNAPFVRKLSERGNERQGFFSESELAAIIAYLPKDIGDLTRFAAICGMRKHECLSLCWRDIDGDQLVLRAENSKNGQSRTIPMTGELAAILQRRRAARSFEMDGVTRISEFVFHRRGKSLADFRKSWRSACRKANVSGRLFHDLRRTAVRNMVKAGVSPQIAKRISGHKTDSMFQRYSILTTDDLREALAQTEDYRKQNQGA